MKKVFTNKLLPKLEEIVEFRLEDNYKDRHKIVVDKGKRAGPSTDGDVVFLPRTTDTFKEERHNELSIANSTAHEADHIREFYDYFGSEMEVLQQEDKNLVEVYLKRNHSHLSENPALAGMIDNIVKDRRIDHERREQLPGVDRQYKEVFHPAAKYFRPSIRGMQDLDAFFELYLQKALMGKTIEKVPKKYNSILNEVVDITNTADTIWKDKEVTDKVYQIFKENFDITRPLSKTRMPFGNPRHVDGGGSPNGSSSSSSSGQSQEGEESSDSKEFKPGNGFGKEIKPRENRLPEKPPSVVNTDSDDMGKKNDNLPRSNPYLPPQKPVQFEKDDKDFYSSAGGKWDTHVKQIKPIQTPELVKIETLKRKEYYSQIDHMRRIFRKIKQKRKGKRRDYSGDNLSLEDYIQDDLSYKATGVRGTTKYFEQRFNNTIQPSIAIHADISGSTQGIIIEKIRDAFYILGESLSSSDWNYGLYTSNDSLHVLKSPTQKWDKRMSYSILNLKDGGGGIFLHNTSKIIQEDLTRVSGQPKCLVVISDFQVCGGNEEYRITKELLEDGVYPFYIGIGKKNESYVKDVTKGLGEDFYTILGKKELDQLPTKIFEQFKRYRLMR